MSLSSTPFWFAAVFAAGGAFGAIGVRAVLSGSAEDGGKRGAVEPPREPNHEADARATAPSEASDDASKAPVDREALRAVLTELLAEEGRAVADDRAEDLAPAEGISAAEALARLEAAYRAELEGRAGQRQALQGAESAARTEEDLSDVPEEGWGEPLAGRGLDRDPPGELEEVDSGDLGPRLAQAAPTPVPNQKVATQSTGVRIEGVQVHNGDVNHVDARQTHASQVAIINHYQPVFVQPWFGTPPISSSPPSGGVPSSSPAGGGSPLSKPMESAHDQSPWSPVDYSRHHNPWGPTFGRRIP